MLSAGKTAAKTCARADADVEPVDAVLPENGAGQAVPSCRCRRRSVFSVRLCETDADAPAAEVFLHTDLAQVGLLAVGAEILRTVVFMSRMPLVQTALRAAFGNTRS